MRERVSKEKITWACMYTMGFPGGSSGKEFICQCRRHKRSGIDPWVRKIPWKRAWQPTPEFLPGESHEQRSLAGYSLWGRKESDTTGRLHFTSLHMKNSHASEICVFWFKSKCLCIGNEEGCVTKCKVVIISLVVVLLGCLFCFSWIYIV